MNYIKNGLLIKNIKIITIIFMLINFLFIIGSFIKVPDVKVTEIDRTVFKYLFIYWVVDLISLVFIYIRKINLGLVCLTGISTIGLIGLINMKPEAHLMGLIILFYYKIIILLILGLFNRDKK